MLAMVDDGSRSFSRAIARRDGVGLVAKQLRQIFCDVVIDKEMEVEDGFNALVNIWAKSRNGQEIAFHVEFVPSGFTFLYSTFLVIDAFKDELLQRSHKPPIVLGVVVIGEVDESVRALFEHSKTPLVIFSKELGTTKTRLQAAFRQCGVRLPELSDGVVVVPSASSEDVHVLSSRPLLKEQMSLWGELLDWLNTRALAITAIFLLSVVGAITLFAESPLWMTDFALVVATGILFIIMLQDVIADKRRVTNCLNPYLVIQREERKLVVRKNEWELERHLLLKARRNNVYGYRFRVEWTGSSHDVKIECQGDGEIIPQEDQLLKREAPSWGLWELRFAEPMKWGEARRVLLKYTMPDPQQTAQPFHFIGYQHVWKCRELKCRLSLEEGIQPRAVYFVRGADYIRLEKDPNVSDESNEYEISERPVLGAKYHIEWEIKNGNSNK